MNIVHVPRRFTRSSWGGTETVILELCRAQRAAGHDARILTTSALDKPGADEVAGVPVRRCGYFYPWLGLDAEAVRRLDQKGGNLFSWEIARELRRAPFDVAHLHTGKRLGGIVRHAALRRGAPYIVSVHGGALDIASAEEATYTEPTRGKLEWGRLLGLAYGSRRVFDDAAAILCLGVEETARMSAAYPDRRVERFPNGVDADRFATGDGAAFRAARGIPPDAELLLCVGRIDPQKNQLLAVRALPAILAVRPGARLLLVGHVTNDAYRAAILQEARALGVAEKATLIPGIDAASGELADAFHAADLFVLPSVHEPFGIVILEAWAAGLAVLASRVGGIPSFVRDGLDGVLVEPGDVEEFAARAVELLGDAGRRRSLAEAGRNRARGEFSWAALNLRLASIYEEAIRARPLR
ncbi:MAG: glycosyltransferase family 4 protein [Candidatus Sumerlaeia bacterium]|nr:glycosyltransferase family 4 protein [Candidatus Sumerlaeia bacterium]